MILLIIILAIVIAVEIPVAIYRPTEEDTLMLVDLVALLTMLITIKVTA